MIGQLKFYNQALKTWLGEGEFDIFVDPNSRELCKSLLCYGKNTTISEYYELL